MRAGRAGEEMEWWQFEHAHTEPYHAGEKFVNFLHLSRYLEDPRDTDEEYKRAVADPEEE